MSKFNTASFNTTLILFQHSKTVEKILRVCCFLGIKMFCYLSLCFNTLSSVSAEVLNDLSGMCVCICLSVFRITNDCTSSTTPCIPPNNPLTPSCLSIHVQYNDVLCLLEDLLSSMPSLWASFSGLVNVST